MIKLFKQQKSIGGAAMLLGFLTILTQLLGLVKNKFLSSHFGASKDLDIFYAAFKIPDLIFLFIGGLAAGVILIPIFTKLENKSVKEKEEFMARFFNFYSLLLLIVSILFFFLSPYLLSLIFPAYQGEDMEELIFLTRLFLLSPFFMALGNFFISINQRNKIFLPMGLTGFLYNISIILSIVFGAEKFGIKGVAYGVVFGAFLFFIIQLPTILKFRLFKYKKVFLKKNEIFELFKTALPRTLALSFASFIIIFIYSRISELGTEGLITIFTFAFSVFWIPIALINGSYSQAILPSVSKLFSQNKISAFNQVVKKTISHILLIIIPMVGFMIIFSDLITRTLFSSQKFGLFQTHSTAILISILSILIPFLILQLFITRIFYAMGNTKEALITNSVALFSMILLSYLNFDFERFLNFGFVENFGILVSFTFSFILAYVLSSIFIILRLKKKIKDIELFDFKGILKKVSITIFSLIILKYLISFLNFQDSLSFLKNAIQLIIFGLVYILLIIIFSEILREKSYLELKGKVLKKK